MTGDTMVTFDEKSPQPTSPTNSDNSEHTLRGDAIIEIEEEQNTTTRASSVRSEDAQPRMSLISAPKS